MRPRWSEQGAVMIQLEQLLRYFSVGVIYKQYNSDERKAMKKVKPDPKEQLLLFANKVTEGLTRSNTNLEPRVYVGNKGRR